MQNVLILVAFVTVAYGLAHKVVGRLVHPRYAGAFRGSLVELSEGRLAELAGLRRQPPMELRRG